MSFLVDRKVRDYVDNYEMYLSPNSIFYSREIKVNNYLYPCYYYKKENFYVSSTSVFELIKHKKVFNRNYKFTTNHFYRPSFTTIDNKINRFFKRTKSTYELDDPKKITEIGAKLMQEYITEIENYFPDYAHLLLMGGKDSLNILLCNRKSKWIVLSGEPNTLNSKEFIENNKLDISDFIRGKPEVDNSFYESEVTCSDCLFDPSHIRWIPQIKEVVDQHQGKIVLWMGTNGDGIFAKNNNHRDKNYFAVQDLHVGTAMGVWHQAYKNFFNIPVLSPYQSPGMIKELISKFNPYYVNKSGDIRKQIGQILHGREVNYPTSNPTPPVYSRNRKYEIAIYIKHLKKSDVEINNPFLKSYLFDKNDKFLRFFEKHSNRKRTSLSKILFPLRNFLANIFPILKNNRHDISNLEIK